MFENSENTKIENQGKSKLIKNILSAIEKNNKTFVVPPGDDAAIIPFIKNKQIVLASNTLVEDVNFDIIYTPLKHLGYKSITTSISNIYAMNATPEYILVNIAFSNKYTMEAIEELYSGINLACNKYKILLAGGDTNTAPKGLTISVSVVGSVNLKNYVLRSTCQKGDLLCVSGDLGGAYMGFHLLEREKRIFMENKNFKPDIEAYNYIIERQLKPEARKDIIELFDSKSIKPTSMTDLSNGLADGMRKIAEQSKVGFDIYENKLPIDNQTLQLASEMNLDATMCILSGGEDYELLFTISQNDYEKIKSNIDITVIGYATAETGICSLITPNGTKTEIKTIN
ncbi:MAG: thiamine-phosphate kinase [Bacteroidia bacterium]|nr:thiamine-phosphate kinase [Bacteroidia bacterium]